MGHTVQYGVVGGVGMGTILVAGNETLAQLSGLVSSTEYWIQVAAVNNVGTGEFSSSITQGTEGKYTQTLQAGTVRLTLSTEALHPLIAIPHIT